jgi:uncharacterized protein with HEPN domain
LRAEDRDRLAHMIDAADAMAAFVTGRAREDLDSDRMVLFAVVRAIEVLGEAASRVSADVRDSAPEVPWAAIVAMRNRLIHGYFDVDATLVWKTATEEIPDLLPHLRALRDRG